MTETTPDYAGLIDRLQSAYTAWNNPPSECLPDDAGCVLEAIQAIRTLLESNAALERELEMWREVKHSSHWKARAEEAEAKLAEAMKVIAPFALVAECDIGEDEGDGDIFWPISNARYSMAGRLRVGHLRAARAYRDKGRE